MKGFNPASSFGEKIAAQDAHYLRGDEEAAAAFLSDLAAGRPALEFAIGTGRIAIPLAKRGIQVDGIEISPHMVERLHTKIENYPITVTIGDMSTTATNKQYGLVYLVFNSIFNLLTVDDQVRCFQNAAHHLSHDGFFVVETALPHAWISPDRSDYVHAEQVDIDSVTLDVALYDPITQLLEENHVHLTTNGIQMSPMVARLITPGEMDLMARIAGMRLIQRYANWQKTVFDSHSTAHISVYGF
jgi:SAM-dependent methyltransferase